jgi:hypothetical protein
MDKIDWERVIMNAALAVALMGVLCSFGVWLANNYLDFFP